MTRRGSGARRREAAAFLGVPVVRRPSATAVTVAGGCLTASGPVGGSLTGIEALRDGDRVWFRHATAGEPAEHIRQVHLVPADAVVDTVPSYRGLDRAW